jgi:hypothetical protein
MSMHCIALYADCKHECMCMRRYTNYQLSQKTCSNRGEILNDTTVSLSNGNLPYMYVEPDPPIANLFNVNEHSCKGTGVLGISMTSVL